MYVFFICNLQPHNNPGRCSSINGGQFHRDRILLREWDLVYFVAPRMSIGACAVVRRFESTKRPE